MDAKDLTKDQLKLLVIGEEAGVLDEEKTNLLIQARQLGMAPRPMQAGGDYEDVRTEPLSDIMLGKQRPLEVPEQNSLKDLMQAGLGEKAGGAIANSYTGKGLQQLLGFLVGAGRGVPGSDLLSAGVGYGLDRVMGAPGGGEARDFMDIYRKHKKIGKGLESETPVASVAGSVAPAIAMYQGGMGALSKIPQVAKAGQILDKGGKIAHLVKGTGKALAGGGLGVGIGQSKEPTGDPLDMAIQFGLGAAAEVAPAMLKGTGKKMKGAGKWLYKHAIKATKGDLAKGKDVAEEAFERGIWGTKGSINRKADVMIDEVERVLQKTLKKSGKINRKTVIAELNRLKQKFAKLPSREREIAFVNRYIKNINKQWDDMLKGTGKKNITAKEANVLKRELYKARQSSYGKADMSNLPVRADADVHAARGYRRAIENTVKDARGLNEDLSFWGRLADATEAPAAPGNILPLRELMLGLGSGLKYGPGAGLGATAAFHAGKSTLGMTGLGQLLRQLGRLSSGTGTTLNYAIPGAIPSLTEGEHYLRGK